MPLAQQRLTALLAAATRAQQTAAELREEILKAHAGYIDGSQTAELALNALAAFAASAASQIAPADAALVAKEREHLRLTFRRNERRRLKRQQTAVGAITGRPRGLAKAACSFVLAEGGRARERTRNSSDGC